MLQNTQVIDWNELTENAKCDNRVTTGVTNRNLTQIYISGTLQTVKAYSCGQWLHVNGHWHRLLDTQTYLWIRDQVTTAIKSGRLADGAESALNSLAAIRDAGLESGQLTESGIGEHCRAASHFVWLENVPRWAEWVDENFEPPLTAPKP